MIKPTYSRLAMLLAVVATCLAMASCGGGGLEKAVKTAFINGDTTQATYDSICSIIKDNPKKYS
ncbi:MAG: hypothetical protein IKX63_08180, partial [Muribaculaceae bacterium]|nr:hypothetical protein [Muribaculaceae bacterium]